MRMLRWAIVGLLFLSSSGCQYYRVRDVATGKEYITNNWSLRQSGFTGSTQFTDFKTGKEVTLQAYEREKIPSDAAKREISSGKN